MDDGFGDKKLGSNEIKTGLNFLLSTNINDVDAKNILNIMDRDGDGEIDMLQPTIYPVRKNDKCFVLPTIDNIQLGN